MRDLTSAHAGYRCLLAAALFSRFSFLTHS